MKRRPKVVVRVGLSRADVLFLHSLLCCYESPFTLLGEVAKRREDERAAECLRRKLALLLRSEG